MLLCLVGRSRRTEGLYVIVVPVIRCWGKSTQFSMRAMMTFSTCLPMFTIPPLYNSNSYKCEVIAPFGFNLCFPGDWCCYISTNHLTTICMTCSEEFLLRCFPHFCRKIVRLLLGYLGSSHILKILVRCVVCEPCVLLYQLPFNPADCFLCVRRFHLAPSHLDMFAFPVLLRA